RADVRHRLLPADVLLARLQGHAKGPVTVRVAGEADDSPRHLPDVLLTTSEDPEQRAAEIHRRPEGLSLANHDVRPDGPPCTPDRLRDRVHAAEEDRIRPVAHLLP